jgi:hypothetical protein
MNFLLILTIIIIVALSLFITNKEGVRNYTTSLTMDMPVCQKMKAMDKGAYEDVLYFNNVTNLLYGYERMIN